MSIDSKYGASNIMGCLPIRAFVLAKLSRVKMYRFEFSSNHGSRFCVGMRLSGSWLTGLQSARVLGNLGQQLTFVNGGGADTPARCTALPDARPGVNRLQNGLQIFPGGVPIYRGGQLVGAIGVSGDGIDQDDMISALGLTGAGGSLNHPAPAIRSDTVVVVQGATSTRLRYVNCPFAPYIDSGASNVCSGI